MFNRIRTITAEGRILVGDKSFSQTVAMLQGLTKAQTEAFWAKQETMLPNGDSVYLVQEGC